MTRCEAKSAENPAVAGRSPSSSAWIRTRDLTIMSRALSPLSYGAAAAEFRGCLVAFTV